MLVNGSTVNGVAVNGAAVVATPPPPQPAGETISISSAQGQAAVFSGASGSRALSLSSGQVAKAAIVANAKLTFSLASAQGQNPAITLGVQLNVYVDTGQVQQSALLVKAIRNVINATSQSQGAQVTTTLSTNSAIITTQAQRAAFDIFQDVKIEVHTSQMQTSAWQALASMRPVIAAGQVQAVGAAIYPSLRIESAQVQKTTDAIFYVDGRAIIRTNQAQESIGTAASDSGRIESFQVQGAEASARRAIYAVILSQQAQKTAIETEFIKSIITGQVQSPSIQTSSAISASIVSEQVFNFVARFIPVKSTAIEASQNQSSIGSISWRITLDDTISRGEYVIVPPESIHAFVPAIAYSVVVPEFDNSTETSGSDFVAIIQENALLAEVEKQNTTAYLEAA